MGLADSGVDVNTCMFADPASRRAAPAPMRVLTGSRSGPLAVRGYSTVDLAPVPGQRVFDASLHRKIVQYVYGQRRAPSTCECLPHSDTGRGDQTDAGDGHGTHVAGSILGPSRTRPVRRRAYGSTQARRAPAAAET